VEKLRRYSTFVISLKRAQEVCARKVRAGVASAGVGETSSEKEHLAFSRNPQGGGIDGQDSQRKTAKSRQPLDLGKVAQGLSPKEQRKNPEETSGYWRHRVFIRLRIETLKVPKSREGSQPLISAGHVSGDPGRVGVSFGESGFPEARNSCI
jgi:hypothetical protein